MQIHAAGNRIQIGRIEDLATSPHVVIQLGTAPDGLPWLVRVDRSKELSTLFQVVPRVFGLTRREDLPTRVREALEHEVASGLMGVHDVAIEGRTARAFVARRKLKALLGPTLFAQLFDRRPVVGDAANDPITAVGAMAAREQDVALLDAVDRTIDALRAKRHLALDLATGGAYACSVRDTDRALRVPSEPIRPLAFETLSALGDVKAIVGSAAGSWSAHLADRAGYQLALTNAHRDSHGGWLRFEIERQQLLAQLVKVARAVDTLHRRERVHADLAPGNVLICSDGARAFDGLDLEAGSPATAATFEWAAPEQIVGHPVDPRTDVYALGRIATAVLGAVVFGEQTEYIVPIGGDRSRHVKLLKAEGVFLDITDTDHDRAWQRAWQELLGRSVHFDRSRRPATAGIFADELAALVEQYPVPARRSLEPAFGDTVAVETANGIEFAHILSD
ncbi:MAG: protein kinase domain-containing protein [Kofleriaceae bacterium]